MIIRGVSVLFQVALYTVAIRDVVRVSVAFSAKTFRQDVGSIPIGSGVGGTQKAGEDGGASP